MKGHVHNSLDVAERLDQFRSVCENQGLRITPQRVAVYEILLKSKDHPSAVTVFEQIRKKYPNVSLDTVNRTLLTIAELGLATTIPGSGDAKRFDADINHHQHFRCLKCKKIVDFECPGFENMKLPKEIRKRFIVVTKTLYLEGICNNCKRQDKKSKCKN